MTIFNTFHCVCGVVGCDDSCCDCPECKPGAWPQAVLDAWYGTPSELSPGEVAAEALADAQQEALTDTECYCDDVDICPPCMRYIAERSGPVQAPRGQFPRPRITR